MKSEMLAGLKAKYEALQATIENEYASQEPPAELQEKLKDAIREYQNAKAEAEKEATKNNNKGVVVTMNKRAMKNQIFKAMLKGQEFTDEMKASGIDLPKYVDTLGETGQVGANAPRGGYLVSEEFLDVDVYGGEVTPIPARDIQVSKPTGKIPSFNLSQAKEAGKFLVPFDELDEIAKKQVVFGQLDFTSIDKAGIVPLSNRILEDADSDVLGLVTEALLTAAAYQRNQDIVSALMSASIGSAKIGSDKDFDDVESIDAIIKAVRVKLTGVNRAKAQIVVPDTVFGKLATIKNLEGNYYIRPMAYDSARFQLDGVEIISVDDSHFTVSDSLVECALVGNFDRVAFFNRKGMAIATSSEAGFTSDSLLVRGVKRSCVKVLEATAFVKVEPGA